MGLPYGSYGFKDITNKHGTGIKVLCKWDPDDIRTLYVQPPKSSEWIEATCRWQSHADGLSHNQHRLIQKHARENYKNSDRQEALQLSKNDLHDWFSSITRKNLKSSDAKQAGKFADFTSSHVFKPMNTSPGERRQIDEKPPGNSLPRVLIEEDYKFMTKDVPTFDSFSG